MVEEQQQPQHCSSSMANSNSSSSSSDQPGDELINNNNLPITTILGKYSIGKKLGQGNFAKVYHCRNISTNDSVAIKVINKSDLTITTTKKTSFSYSQQIQREISVMKLVRHPNIVEIKEVLATKTKIYVVMEYIKGGELFTKILNEGKVNEEQARKYFHQLLSAVDFCHSRGVTHRDLKPENLLLDHNGDLKVSDFGLSALPEQRRGKDGLLYTQCGTPSYVAPEVLRTKGYVGQKADIWSCGVVLFVLLAGYLPFHDENVVRMYRKVFKGEYEFPDWVSDDAKRLVRKILVVDPVKRVSIDGIMKCDPWYLQGGGLGNNAPEGFDDDDDDNSVSVTTTTSSSPRFYNAFDLISSLSSGFDLSNLFIDDNKKMKRSTIFTSKLSASEVIRRLKSVQLHGGFSIVNCKEEEYYGVLRMEGKSTEGRKLAVLAEVFEVAPNQLAVVEFSKCYGDSLEYVRLCEEVIRPALKDIVWRWHCEEVKE